MIEARLFQALSDATRLKILGLLARGSMNVSGMVSELGYAQPAVSRHLRVLKDVGLIHDRRHGKEVEYSLNHGRVGDAVGYLEGLVGVVAADGGGVGAGGKGRRRRSGDATEAPTAEAGVKPKAKRRVETEPKARRSREEPEYTIARKDDDGMDDFLL